MPDFKRDLCVWKPILSYVFIDFLGQREAYKYKANWANEEDMNALN